MTDKYVVVISKNEWIVSRQFFSNKKDAKAEVKRLVNIRKVNKIAFNVDIIENKKDN